LESALPVLENMMPLDKNKLKTIFSFGTRLFSPRSTFYWE